MRKINLDELKNGQPGISSNVAAFLVEAAVLCLTQNGHKSGVLLKVSGDFVEDFKLIWSDKIDLRKRRSWKDTNEATEYGATAIAALLTKILVNSVVYERAPQGDAADYYLEEKTNNKINAMLEVSGIMKSSKTNTPAIRVNIKKKRIEQSSVNKQLPIYIIVTEFGKPKTKITKV